MKLGALQVSEQVIGTETKTIAFFEVENDSKAINATSVHHIHVLDRSGSMYSHIESLMDDVKKTLIMCEDDDLITVLWFNSPGSYRTVIKAARAGDRENLGKIMDSLKSVFGCTCFSDPISELKNIIDETLPLCDIYNVTIFTDGDTVTPWSVSEETERIFRNLDVIKNKIVAFNAIGYGNYYNRELLQKMVKTTEYGQLTHASKIDEYSQIFSRNKQIIENLVGKRFEIVVPNSTIINLTSKTVKSSKNSLSVRLAKSRNLFAILFDGQVIEPRLEINTSDGHFGTYEKVKIFESGTLQDILYAAAYVYFNNNERSKSLEFLNVLGDEPLMKRQVNSFTIQEVGEYLKYLQKVIFNHKEVERTPSEVLSNKIMPDKNAYCVFELLQDLVADNALYMPTKDYQRVSQKRVDNFNLFKANPDQALVPLNKLILNQDRLNISIRFEITGHIKLNPKRAAQVDLEDTQPAKIYRNHTIIQDGNLNIRFLNVVVSEKLCQRILPYTSDGTQGSPETGYQITLDLTKLPVINQSYLENATALRFLEIEKELLQIEAQQKYINSVLSEDSKFEGVSNKNYTAEQIAVLIEHGMKTPGIYTSIQPVTEESDDFLVVREFRTMLKGFATLPSFKKVDEKVASGKPMTAGEALLERYRQALKGSADTALVKLRNQNSRYLTDLRFELSASKLALILTGAGLPEGVIKQDDNSFIYTQGTDTLVLKVERKEIPV